MNSVYPFKLRLSLVLINFDAGWGDFSIKGVGLGMFFCEPLLNQIRAVGGLG